MKRNIQLILSALIAVTILAGCNNPKSAYKRMLNKHIKIAKLDVKGDILRYKLGDIDPEKDRKEYARYRSKIQKLNNKMTKQEMKAEKISFKLFKKYYEDKSDWKEIMDKLSMVLAEEAYARGDYDDDDDDEDKMAEFEDYFWDAKEEHAEEYLDYYYY